MKTKSICPICNDEFGWGWIWSYSKDKLIPCPNCNHTGKKKKK